MHFTNRKLKREPSKTTTRDAYDKKESNSLVTSVCCQHDAVITSKGILRAIYYIKSYLLKFTWLIIFWPQTQMSAYLAKLTYWTTLRSQHLVTASNLGVTHEQSNVLLFHTTTQTSSCPFLLYNIRRIYPFLSKEATRVIVQSLVISRIDYCSSCGSVWFRRQLHELFM